MEYEYSPTFASMLDAKPVECVNEVSYQLIKSAKNRPSMVPMTIQMGLVDG